MEFVHKINQDSKLYQQIVEFYKLHSQSVEFVCLNYEIHCSDEEFDKYQEIIISKKVAEIIKKNVPYANFYPIFGADKE